MSPRQYFAITSIVWAVGAVFAACTGVAGGPSRDLCLTKEIEEKIYEYEKNTACGCNQIECAENTMCFHHDCCNPDIDGKRRETCGCAAVCGDGELCVSYSDARGTACCDPESASDPDYCGCTGACLDTEACLKGEDDIYSCVCDPKLAQYNDDDCGCTGQTCDGATDCISGKCTCTPINDEAKTDRLNCGCNGPCPTGAFCKNGGCICESEDSIICCVGEDGPECERGCVPQDECVCDPDQHRGDTLNCGCSGPCAGGDKCVDASCRCDPLANATNGADCGCDGPCGPGLECQSGACICPPWKLGDNNDCGCSGPCPEGVKCNGGVCDSCAAAKLIDPTDCGCKGPCPDGYECAGGTCQCPAWKMNDEADCGCGGPCTPGFECAGGTCQCPASKMSDEADCGCDGPCAAGLECAAGTCQCPASKMSDEVDCGCNGPCPAKYECHAGSCQCPASKMSDESDCGCGGPCGADLECIQGVCQCSPAKMTDPTDCGCQGPCGYIAYGPDMVCSNGVCQCPPDFSYCQAAGNLDPNLQKNTTACLETGNNYCFNCSNFCPKGSFCHHFDNNDDNLIETLECVQPG